VGTALGNPGLVRLSSRAGPGVNDGRTGKTVAMTTVAHKTAATLLRTLACLTCLPMLLAGCDSAEDPDPGPTSATPIRAFTADLGDITIHWRDHEPAYTSSPEDRNDHVWSSDNPSCAYAEVHSAGHVLGTNDQACDQYGEPTRWAGPDSRVVFTVPLGDVRRAEGEWSRCTNSCPGYIQQYAVYSVTFLDPAKGGPTTLYLVQNVDEDDEPDDAAAKAFLTEVNVTN